MPGQTSLLLGRPEAGLDLPGALRTALAGAPGQMRVRFGCPFVSNAGLDILLSGLDSDNAWRRADKEWIIGIRHGITEPAAIERLRDLDRSVVRIFVGGRRLRADSLVSGRLFHAKVAFVESIQGNNTSLLAGSANLTSAALGPSAINYEAGVWIGSGAASQAHRTQFEAWWQEAWGQSIDVTDRVLQDYTRFRDSFLDRNPDTLVGVDPPSLDRLDSASVLWIEAGAMSGGSRNQIEFGRDLARFFGRVTNRSRNLRIEVNGRLYVDRPLTPKTTTFGVEIWRLSLPTERQCGLVYPGTVIRFQKRRAQQGRLYFELDVADPGSAEHDAWRASAHSRGYIGVTSGGGRRTYGFC